MSIPHEESDFHGDTSILNKIANVFIVALMFGLGSHIRGSGMSDPIAPMLMFLLFVGFLFKGRKKFNAITFGMIVLFFRLMCRGWGTFFSRSGISGISAGKFAFSTERYSIIVPWWQEYFWLFLVGLAWSGLMALILRGYNFSKKIMFYKLYIKYKRR
ncbi:MAG: hypothetical protein ACOC44_06990 [Promethearchaeia archaeon]